MRRKFLFPDEGTGGGQTASNEANNTSNANSESGEPTKDGGEKANSGGAEEPDENKKPQGTSASSQENKIQDESSSAEEQASPSVFAYGDLKAHAIERYPELSEEEAISKMLDEYESNSQKIVQNLADLKKQHQVVTGASDPVASQPVLQEKPVAAPVARKLDLGHNSAGDQITAEAAGVR